MYGDFDDWDNEDPWREDDFDGDEGEEREEDEDEEVDHQDIGAYYDDNLDDNESDAEYAIYDDDWDT